MNARPAACRHASPWPGDPGRAPPRPLQDLPSGRVASARELRRRITICSDGCIHRCIFPRCAGGSSRRFSLRAALRGVGGGWPDIPRVHRSGAEGRSSPPGCLVGCRDRLQDGHACGACLTHHVRGTSPAGEGHDQIGLALHQHPAVADRARRPAMPLPVRRESQLSRISDRRAHSPASLSAPAASPWMTTSILASDAIRSSALRRPFLSVNARPPQTRTRNPPSLRS